MTLFVIRNFLRELGDKMLALGTGSNEVHLATKDIPELRYLIDAKLADDFADARRAIIISAGFDAHMRDPLANLNFLEPDYAWVTQKLMEVADRCANGRGVSLLEGGYDLEGLAKSVAAHVTTLMRG